MRFDKFQNIRTNLHAFQKGPPIKIDRYDSILPRPSPALFRWHLNYHHEDKIRSPIPSPLSGLGSGELYRPPTPPWLSERQPPRIVWRNGRWEYLCRLAGPETGCDRSFVNGLEEQKHIQADHISPGDHPALYRGETFFPATWYAKGRITDVRGRQEAMAKPTAYQQRIRARPGSPLYARSLARKLA